jgi:hypothetical protein
LSEILGKQDGAHLRLQEYLAQFEPQFQSEQHDLSPRRLREHQGEIRRAIQDILGDINSEHALRTWIQYIPGRELDACVEAVIQLESPAFDEFAERIGDFYKATENFVQRIREQTASEEAQKLLDNLALQEQQAAKRFSASLLGLNDI